MVILRKICGFVFVRSFDEEGLSFYHRRILHIMRNMFIFIILHVRYDDIRYFFGVFGGDFMYKKQPGSTTTI